MLREQGRQFFCVRAPAQTVALAPVLKDIRQVSEHRRAGRSGRSGRWRRRHGSFALSRPLSAATAAFNHDAVHVEPQQRTDASPKVKAGA